MPPAADSESLLVLSLWLLFAVQFYPAFLAHDWVSAVFATGLVAAWRYFYW